MVTLDILEIGAIAGALLAIATIFIGLIRPVHKFIKKVDKHIERVTTINEKQQEDLARKTRLLHALCDGVIGTIDALIEMGANGPTHAAREKLVAEIKNEFFDVSKYEKKGE